MNISIEAERKAFVANYSKAKPVACGDFVRNGDGCFAAHRMEELFIGWLLARSAIAALPSALKSDSRKARFAFENIRNGYVNWPDNPNFAVLEAAIATPPAPPALSDDGADFYRGVIAALGVLTAHGYSHGSVYHDEIVQSVGATGLYAAAEEEDYKWAGLDPAILAKAQPTATSSSEDTVRIDWLDAQERIHALQWHCGEHGVPVKTRFYDRDRVLISEGISLRHAIDAAMQTPTDKD